MIAEVVILATLSQIILPPPPPLPLPPLPPLPPPPCLIQPCLPPPPLPIPPPGDDPPILVGKLTLTRDGKKYVIAKWPPATDDVGVWGYRIYRDGNVVARKPADVHRARLLLPCGAHRYRVEAVDTVEQVASLSRRVTRTCPP